MDKVDFLSSLKSTRREFRAKILSFSIDEPYASALARNAQGMLTAWIGSEMERLQVVALLVPQDNEGAKWMSVHGAL